MVRPDGRSIVRYAMAHKAWWLVPMVVVALLLGAVFVLGETPLAPFIYSVF